MMAAAALLTLVLTFLQQEQHLPSQVLKRQSRAAGGHAPGAA